MGPTLSLGPTLSVVQLPTRRAGERGYVMTPAPTLTLLYHGCPAFLHRRFPAPPPSSPPPDLALHSQQLPLRWACSRTLNSSSQLLDLPGDLNPCPGCVWLQQGLSDSHSVRLPQSSCFTVSLKCFSSASDSCPNLGSRPLFQSPTCQGWVRSY